MKIPLLIGKDSAGKNQFIDLSDIPVLMISHCDELQLTSIFSQFGLFESSTRHYLITNTRYYNIWKFDKERFRVFMRDEPEFDIISRNDLINQIIDEIINRQKIMRQKKINDFERYNSLNTWNDIKLDYLFLFIDDIWDIIVSKPKKLALNFMMILLYGQYVGVHVVFASAISYRNLLQQLVGIYPILTIELKKKYGIPEPVKISDLGQELFFTPDGLVYYKKNAISDLLKYYKL
jgi:hypothetical protein